MTNFADLEIKKFADAGIDAGIDAGECATLIEVPKAIFQKEIDDINLSVPFELKTIVNTVNHCEFYVVRESQNSSNPGNLVGLVFLKYCPKSGQDLERINYLSTDYFKADYIDFQINKRYQQAA